MLIYAISLSALVAIIYLIQFQAYKYYHDKNLIKGLSTINELLVEGVTVYELAVEEQLSGVKLA
jgi:hypothetical protein